MFDGKSNLWIVVDYGAAVSVLPYNMSLTYSGQEPESYRALESVNGTRLKTYGHEVAKIQIGRKTYEIEYVLADIKQPIIGWNFIKKYKLWTGWNRWGDPMLIDKKACINATMRLDEDDIRGISSLKYVYKNTAQRNFRPEQIGAVEYEGFARLLLGFGIGIWWHI